MSNQIREILFQSLFYSWARQSHTPFEIETATSLIEEGSVGRELLVLIDGTADVNSAQRDGDTAAIAMLEAPDIFGEM